MPGKKSKISAWQPIYTISFAAAKYLMEIEAARTIVDNTALTASMETQLRHNARLRSTHYSTRIEGNRLTLRQAMDVIENKSSDKALPSRDVREVRNYWEALTKIEDWAAAKVEFSEDLIRRVHGIVERGLRAKASNYRDGQNVIRDSQGGRIVYMPPEAKDVPGLMKGMVKWVQKSEREKIPVPIIAALVHYQFVTIHPYYDGNGRTARLLATFILQRDGYGLHGFFSMEEHHARDLAGYYRSLVVHEHHNYYFGIAEADLSGWVEYFLRLLARVFNLAKDEVLKCGPDSAMPDSSKLRELDHRARVVLGLFTEKDEIVTKDVADALGLSARMARNLLKQWVGDGLLIIADEANRSRRYGLSEIYRKFIGNTSDPDKTE